MRWHNNGNYIYDSDSLSVVGKAFEINGLFSIEQAVEHAALMAQAPELEARAEEAEAIINQLRTIATDALAYESDNSYDVGVEDEWEKRRIALELIRSI